MKRQPVKVLLIEDESSYAELVRVVLAESPTLQFALTHFTALEPALQQLTLPGGANVSDAMVTAGVALY